MATATKNNGEKILSLSKHLESLRNKVSSGHVGTKHKDRPQAYKEWLKIEINRTEKKIESLKVG